MDDQPIPKRLFGELAGWIIDKGAKRVVKFLAPNRVVKATRKTYRGQTRREALRDPSTTIIFTISRPNYSERLFVKQCKRAEVPFPVKKVRVTWLKDSKQSKRRKRSKKRR
jgi:hypothetical protein